MNGLETVAILSGLLQLSADAIRASQAIQKAQMEGRDISDDEMNQVFELMNSASKSAQDVLRARAQK